MISNMYLNLKFKNEGNRFSNLYPVVEEVVASAVQTVKIGNEKCHLRGGERERPALVDADVLVWVYRGTVYSAKGTT
jgi:hypothetical protein